MELVKSVPYCKNLWGLGVDMAVGTAFGMAFGMSFGMAVGNSPQQRLHIFRGMLR